MRLEFEIIEEILIVKVAGELDLHTADNLKKKIVKKLEQNNKLNNIVLDLNNIKFIDSSGLGAILSLYKKLKAQQGKIAVINLSQQVKRIFNLSGVLKLLVVAKTKAVALKQIRRNENCG